MLDKDGHIKIIDFGLAVDGMNGDKVVSDRTGTFEYMAPEVLQEKPYGKEVDWWSLGVTLTGMATGRHPFYNGPHKQLLYKAVLKEKPTFPTWLEPDAKHFLKQLLRKRPQKRLGVSHNIREHPFLKDIDWAEIESRRVRPPFLPFMHVPELQEHPSLELKLEDSMAADPIPGFSFIGDTE
ncbi:protein kinase C delta type-like [Pseudophryne corroboree]|uniref:protein kinase C delta type-like n=1 Tax=Pseudophryne corroboree TaxID=495146 RepID=UPI0030818193